MLNYFQLVFDLCTTGTTTTYYKYFYYYHYYPLLLLSLLFLSILIYSTQHFYYTTSSGDGYLELDVNIKKFGLLANKTLPLLLSRLHCMDLHIGLCVESREEEEMPEGMLCSVRVHKVSAEPSAVPMWFVRNTST